MFQPGELLVYGSTGVCRVEGVTHLNQTGPDRNRQYYILKPLLQDGVIYTPVDNRKIPIRPVITAEEAEALIDLIPTIQADVCRAPTLQALAQQDAVVLLAQCGESAYRLIEEEMEIAADRSKLLGCILVNG
jgi:CarD family transcriptional regulator